jgi:uncharacterized membrane protein
VVAVILTPPTLIHLALGQVVFLCILLLLAAGTAVERDRFVLAGLCFVPIAKPQIGLLVVPGLVLVAYRAGGFKGALKLVGTAALVDAVCTLPLWIGYPNWVETFVRNYRTNPDFLQPSLHTWLRLWLGESAGWVGFGLFVMVLLWINLRLWWRYPVSEALPWSLALTGLASPYVWTYDFVLFLPLVLQTLTRQRQRSSRLVWVLGFSLLWALTVGVRLVTDMSFHWHAWMPWFFFALVAGSHWAEHARSTERVPLLTHSTGSSD